MFWEYIHSQILRISSMSVAEIAMVNATWLTLTVDEFKCKQTEEILSKRRDAEVAIQYVRKEKGCGVISKVPKVEIDGIEYYSCLCHPNFNDSSVHEYMWLYRQYKAGHLGYAGSLLDQPSKYIELIRFMDRLDAEHQNNQSEGQ